MDKKLTFNTHVNTVCQKSYYALKSIYEYKDIFPGNVKKILTESLVLSIPGYLDIVYGPYLTNYNKYRIQKIQNSCVRYVKGLTRRDHVSQPVSEVYGCNMAQRRFVRMGCQLYKVVIFNEPLYLTELILRRGDIHRVNIRFGDRFDIPRHRTQFFKSCFMYLSAYVYNMLPQNYKILSFPVFKRKIKLYVCDNLLSL